MNTQQKKLIGAAVVILILLVVFTLVLRGVFRGRTPQNQPTPAPTDSFESQGGTRGIAPLSEAEKQRRLNQSATFLDNPLSDEQRERLASLRSKLPIDSNECRIEYSSELNQYFVSKKQADAEDACRRLLEENQVLDIYNAGFGNIVITDLPIAEAIEDARSNILESVGPDDAEIVGAIPTTAPGETITEEEKQRQEEEKNRNAKRDRDLKLFTDLLKTTLSFDLSGGKRLRDVLRSLGDDSDTGGGGTNISGEVICPPNLGQETSSGYYQMPEPRDNEYVFSEGACPAQRYGKRELICVLYTVAVNYKEQFSRSRLRIGDLNASHDEHQTHHYGVGVDITESIGGGKGPAACVSCSGHDAQARQRTIELGKLFIDTGLIRNIFYDDPSVTSALLKYARDNRLPVEGTIAVIGGHDDHFHVDLKAGLRGPDHHPGC